MLNHYPSSKSIISAFLTLAMLLSSLAMAGLAGTVVAQEEIGSVAELAAQDPENIAFCHGGDYCSRAQWQYMTDWLSDYELTIAISAHAIGLDRQTLDEIVIESKELAIP
jgi:hypothetical protein